MASVGGVSGGNSASSGIYGTRNVLSGLASGLDTESMIENAVSGYQTRITSLQQSRTVKEWEQEAYRSIIDKMATFNTKYASYTSDTNLLSASFFNKSIVTSAKGDNASAVSASGKSDSEVRINSVTTLAAAARYRISGAVLGASATPTISAGSAADLTEPTELSTVAGFMTFNYGNKSVSIDLGELELYDSGESLAEAISAKLADKSITTSSGTSVAANTLIEVTADENGNITLTDKANAGNNVYVSGASQNIKTVLGLTTGADTGAAFSVSAERPLSESANTLDYLAGKTISITLDGVSKKLELPGAEDMAGSTDGSAFAAALQAKVDDAFGAGKIGVTNLASGSSAQLSFTAAAGSSMELSSEVSGVLGLEDNETSYLSSAAKLGDLVDLSALTPDENGKYAFVLNGVTVGKYNADTALETVLAGINGNSEAGVGVSFSRTTNEFVFTSKETGVAGDISFGGGLASAMFASRPGEVEGTFTAGTDALLNVTVNGRDMSLTRSSNAIELDGLTVTLKNTFDAGGDAAKAVTFSTTADSDKIVGAIKSMLDDYNAMVKELRSAFTTLPAQKTNGTGYDPLTDEDMAGMSEAAIEKYEKKAKQGLLFGDSDLSTLYTKLLGAISPGGADGAALRSMGITSTYTSGLTTLSLDEEKLRTTLETNPDVVKNAFSKTSEGGGTDGLMTKLKTQLDSYASVTGANKGILVRKAGTTLSSLSLMDNSLQDSIDNIDKQIDKWQSQLGDKIDYYTRQFTALETLINEMNSQSAALTSLLGG